MSPLNNNMYVGRIPINILQQGLQGENKSGVDSLFIMLSSYCHFM